MKNQPLHRFMLVLSAAFIGPQGQSSMKIVNTVVARTKKNVPLGIIKQAQDGVSMQLQMFGIEAQNIVDVTIQNVCYLGHMTEQEFLAGLDESQTANMSIGQTDEEDDAVNPFALKGH